MSEAAEDELLARWMLGYAGRRAALKQANRSIWEAVKDRLKDDGLNFFRVDRRVKSRRSLEAKLRRKTPDGTLKYANGLDDIDDVLGIRVITYLEVDVHRAISAIERSFKVLERVNKTEEQKNKGQFGYCGQHLILKVDPDLGPGTCSPHAGQRFELQFRTILQHAWAEFEHDIRYKGRHPAPPVVNRAFTLASALIELTDKEFGTINEVVAAKEAEGGLRSLADGTEVLTGRTLRVILEQQLPKHPRSKASNYKWMVKILKSQDISTPQQVSALLEQADWDRMAKRMEYKIQPGHVRAIDDFLLSRF